VASRGACQGRGDLVELLLVLGPSGRRHGRGLRALALLAEQQRGSLEGRPGRGADLVLGDGLLDLADGLPQDVEQVLPRPLGALGRACVPRPGAATISHVQGSPSTSYWCAQHGPVTDASVSRAERPGRAAAQSGEAWGGQVTSTFVRPLRAAVTILAGRAGGRRDSGRADHTG